MLDDGDTEETHWLDQAWSAAAHEQPIAAFLTSVKVTNCCLYKQPVRLALRLWRKDGTPSTTRVFVLHRCQGCWPSRQGRMMQASASCMSCRRSSTR
jgi:hypothetical protein